MATVALHGVHKSYGRTPVIHGVSVDIADGEFLTLVGPSGCGKSTLLRMIAGLETITGGEISIGGRVVNDLPPRARDIAMVFQSYALYPHMTVARNMGHALKLAGRPKAEIDRRVRAAADILHLTPLLDRLPRQLSGGQRQRVAMGRAIVRDPKVFLFDEPLSNLDAKLRVQMRSEIKELHQRLRTTTVYVTHDQVEAMTMADRIVVMNAGIVEQVGSPLELYDRPANIFVAGFLGSPAMNMIPGMIAEANGRVQFRADTGGSLELPPGIPRPPPGQPAIFGVRPEHLVTGSNAKAALNLILTVSVVEPTGAETLVLGRWGEAQVTALFRSRLDLRPGESIPIGFSPEHVHFFSPETGERAALAA